MVRRENSLVRQPTRAVAIEERSPHNRVVALIFAVFFGTFGLHRFYTGRYLTGLLWFLTGGLFMFGWIFDLVLLATGTFRDSEGRVLGPPDYEHRPLIASDHQQQRAPQSSRQPSPDQQRRGGPPEAPVDGDPSDPYLEEAMRDPLEEKFDQLEESIKANRGRDGSI